jgi:hypothetical protein
MAAEVEVADRNDDRVYITMPYENIFFLPYISAILPKGRRKTVADRRYEVDTQASKTASILNSRPMEGRAILMEAPIKGVRKDAIVIITNAKVLLTLPFF